MSSISADGELRGGKRRTEKWIEKGPKVRAGFVAKTRINRHDFGVSWNDVVDKGGVVVGNLIDITIDAEAILEGPDESAHEAAAN
jgi:polyisoprenoid-binding protein YceI